MQTILFTLVLNMIGLNFYNENHENDQPVFDYTSMEMRRDCRIDSLLSRAETCIGVKYVYGGTTKKGFDCSGFVNYVFNGFDIKLPRTSRDIAQLGEKVAFDDIRPGDLVFFTGRSSGSRTVGHIAMVTQKTSNGFKMIHASTSRGIIIDDYQTAYYKQRFLFAKRLNVVPPDPVEDCD
jgi:cell wall-associated NlpC family hydrolase